MTTDVGKRSTFARVERDYYPTPKEAVMPLLPFIELAKKRNMAFTEPCAGDGRLAEHITGLGLSCKEMIDISPGRNDIVRGDAMTFDFDTPQLFITNPPWTRTVLHPLIDRLSSLAPTWLLFDADWMHTKQAVPYLTRLKIIVSIGRVKWIEGSKMTGKDNCCWYLFDKQGSGPIMFMGRGEIPEINSEQPKNIMLNRRPQRIERQMKDV